MGCSWKMACLAVPPPMITLRPAGLFSAVSQPNSTPAGACASATGGLSDVYSKHSCSSVNACALHSSVYWTPSKAPSCRASKLAALLPQPQPRQLSSRLSAYEPGVQPNGYPTGWQGSHAHKYHQHTGQNEQRQQQQQTQEQGQHHQRPHQHAADQQHSQKQGQISPEGRIPHFQDLFLQENSTSNGQPYVEPWEQVNAYDPLGVHSPADEQQQAAHGLPATGLPNYSADGHCNGYSGVWQQGNGIAGQYKPSSSPAAAQQLLPAVHLHFSLTRALQFGQYLRIVGSTAQLGSWNAKKGPKMVWQAGHRWTADVTLPAGAYEFKFVLVHRSGHLEWEPGNNRVLLVPASAADMQVQGQWGATDDTEALELRDQQQCQQQLQQQQEHVEDTAAMGAGVNPREASAAAAAADTIKSMLYTPEQGQTAANHGASAAVNEAPSSQETALSTKRSSSRTRRSQSSSSSRSSPDIAAAPLAVSQQQLVSQLLEIRDELNNDIAAMESGLQEVQNELELVQQDIAELKEKHPQQQKETQQLQQQRQQKKRTQLPLSVPQPGQVQSVHGLAGSSMASSSNGDGAGFSNGSSSQVSGSSWYSPACQAQPPIAHISRPAVTSPDLLSMADSHRQQQQRHQHHKQQQHHLAQEVIEVDQEALNLRQELDVVKDNLQIVVQQLQANTAAVHGLEDAMRQQLLRDNRDGHGRAGQGWSRAKHQVRMPVRRSGNRHK